MTWYQCTCKRCGKEFSCSKETDVCFDCEDSYEHYKALMDAVVELRALIFDDFDFAHQSGMAGRAADVVLCAIQWIERRKGIFTTKYGDEVNLQAALDSLNGVLGDAWKHADIEHYRKGLEAAREVLETLAGPDERLWDGEEVI